MPQDLFRDVATEEEQLRAALSQIAFPLKHGSGRVLFRQGEAARGVFLVLKGAVSMFLSLPNGLRLPFSGGVEGLLGLPATITGNPYSLTGQASEDAEVAFAEKGDVLAVLHRRPDLLWPVMRIIADELQQLRAISARWTWLALSRPKGDQGTAPSPRTEPQVHRGLESTGSCS